MMREDAENLMMLVELIQYDDVYISPFNLN